MPNQNRKGPNGEGPRTGKKKGLCGSKAHKNERADSTTEKGHKHQRGQGKGEHCCKNIDVLFLN